MIKVFIDGKAGTTGLRIYERLEKRKDIEILSLSENDRKDVMQRKAMLNAADIVFLCLPDSAAVEAVSLIENENTVVIDASTAHRTNPEWVYGFPEIEPKLFDEIATSKRIAVPGCHASGFIALVKPLIDNSIINNDTLLTCHSITGYSGGGKTMIADYENSSRDKLLCAPRQYGLTQTHKHLKEMKAVTGLLNEPMFSPIVADFYSGMEMTIPIFKNQLCAGKTMDDIKAVYKNLYTGELVKFVEDTSADGMLSAATLSGTDIMHISVFGNEDRILLTAVYDNLGKGASGAAVEILNIVTGSKLTQGLVI